MRKLTFIAGLVAFGILVTPQAARADFSRIPFKYTSLTHLGFQGSVIRTALAPGEVMDILATHLRSNGAMITDIQEYRSRLIQTDADRECERASNQIFSAEFSAYNANSFRQFRRIDRSGVEPLCQPKPSWLQYGYTVQPFDQGAGYQILAVVDRSVDLSQRTTRLGFSSIFTGGFPAGIWSTIPSTEVRRLDLQTIFNIVIWRSSEEEQTSVFVLGVPRSDGVEADPSASIGYPFRSFADGSIEATAARNLLTLVVQRSITARSRE